MTPPDPVAPKQGLSTGAIVGLGCGVFAIILIVVVLIGMRNCVRKVEEMAGDFQKNPAKTAALFAVKANPELELVKTDDATGEITVRNRKTGEETTMAFNEISQGRFRMKSSKGEEVSVDTAVAGGAARMIVKGSDGAATIGGDPALTQPPAWVPAYPAATVRSGGMKLEKKDRISGTILARTADAPGKVREYLESRLKEGGFETEVVAIENDGNQSLVISATKDGGRRKITVTVSHQEGATALAVTYDGPK